MSDLIENLTSIMNTKLEIKKALNTVSDVFAEYPAMITNGSYGTAYIYENGEHEIGGRQYAYVTVPIPIGYTYTYGTYDISTSGTFDIHSYEYVNVSIPSGTYIITSPGTYDISSYAYVTVNIE